MNATITGTLFSAEPTVQRTETFRTRIFILKTSENVNGSIYENYIQFQLVNNNCEILDNFQPNQPVQVTYNLRGNLWTTPEGVQKCITNLNAWKIDPAQQQQAPAPQQAWGQPAPAQTQQATQPSAPAQTWGQSVPTASPQQAWGNPTTAQPQPNQGQEQDLPF